jgi:hypothetical protein
MQKIGCAEPLLFCKARKPDSKTSCCANIIMPRCHMTCHMITFQYCYRQLTRVTGELEVYTANQKPPSPPLYKRTCRFLVMQHCCLETVRNITLSRSMSMEQSQMLRCGRVAGNFVVEASFALCILPCRHSCSHSRSLRELWFAEPESHLAVVRSFAWSGSSDCYSLLCSGPQRDGVVAALGPACAHAGGLDAEHSAVEQPDEWKVGNDDGGGAFSHVPVYPSVVKYIRERT